MLSVTKEQFKTYPKVDYVLSKYLYSFRDHINKQNNTLEKNQRNIKKIRTQKQSYKSHYYNISLFDKYLYLVYKDTDFSVNDIKEKDIEDFLKYCSLILGNKPVTINQKLVSIRLLMKYICTYFKDVLPYNIALQVKTQKTPYKKPTYITYSEISTILNIIRNNTFGLRDVCICKIIMTTGIKIGDIFNLKVNDIDLSNKEIIYSDSNNDIHFPIQDTLLNDLKDYLSLRNNIKTDNNFLFLNMQGNKKNIRSFQITFRNAVIKANIEKSYTAQNLRASFLYSMGQLVDKDEDLQIISNQKFVKPYLKLHENPLNNIK